MSARRHTFELYLGPLGPAELTVTTFRGHEALSRPFVFEVGFLAETDVLAAEPALLGAPVTLTMALAGRPPRVVQGLAAALGSRGSMLDGKRGFRLRLVPRLWLLGRRKNSRIFQDLSLVEIIDAVLAQHAVARRWDLSSTYKRRSYCVQYRETDLAFVSRLLAEEGIFYFLEPPPGLAAALDRGDAGAGTLGLAEQVVFCDAADRYPPMPDGIEAAMGGVVRLPAPVLAFRASEPGQVGDESLHRFDVRRSLRATAMHVRDHDFERPLLSLTADAEVEDADGSGGELEVYEHHGEYWEADVSPENAAVRLQQLRARASLVKAAGDCRRLSPGVRFTLDGHPQPELDRQEYAVVEVNHEGANPAYAPTGSGAPRVYANTLTCVAASVPYRPDRPRRELGQVLESAIVVGPVGEEIHTDRLGRIKVQFHWDRLGENNEHSSCWIRVMQPMAGASWGFQFLPRVGMEVLVSFLGGDEDRPVVMGSVYNATHPPPFPLPQSKTRSGIRTRSVGGQGGSELSFEDGAGAELVYLKAQRDLTEHVLRDHEVHVGGGQTTTVTGAQQASVGGPRHVTVGGDDSASVVGSQLETIALDHRQSVGGRHLTTIEGDATTSVHGVSVHNAANESSIVEGYATLSVGTEDRPAGRAVMVHGDESHDATRTLTLTAGTSLRLECGDTAIMLTPDSVRIDARTIVIKAKEKLVLLGDGPGIELHKEADILADTIKLFSKGGSIELDAEAAHVDGPVVKLNCGAGDEPEIDDEVEKPKTKPFRWKCLDENLEPYADRVYRLITQGFKAKGKTDGAGVIEQAIPERAFLARITLWTGVFPESDRLHYAVRLGELAPASSVVGAQIRLQNLGYYEGPESDEVSPELASALLEFQHDHGVPATGSLDGATAAKLDEVHPT